LSLNWSLEAIQRFLKSVALGETMLATRKPTLWICQHVENS